MNPLAKKFSLVLILIILAVLARPGVAKAFVIIPTDCTDSYNDCPSGQPSGESGPGGRTVQCSTCDFNDFIQLFINLAQAGLSLIGVVAIFLFINAGFSLVTSSGNPEKVKAAKAALSGTVLGLMIVACAWVLVNTGIGLMTGQTSGGAVTIFGKPWWQLPVSSNDCRRDYDQDCSKSMLQVKCGDGLHDERHDVTDLETMLADLKCYSGPQDGCYTAAVKLAVEKFQETNRLTVNGVIDDGTRNVLYGAAPRIPCP